MIWWKGHIHGGLRGRSSSPFRSIGQIATVTIMNLGWGREEYPDVLCSKFEEKHLRTRKGKSEGERGLELSE